MGVRMSRIAGVSRRHWAVAAITALAVGVPATVVAATTSPSPSPPVKEKYKISKSSSYDESDVGKLAAAAAAELSTRSSDLGDAGPVTRVVSGPARTVWVASATNGLCVMVLEANVADPNGACYSSELILRGDAWQQAEGSDGYLLTALVPDDVTSVRITRKDGSTVKVATRSNVVYSIDVSPAVGYSYSSGGKAFDVNVISG